MKKLSILFLLVSINYAENYSKFYNSIIWLNLLHITDGESDIKDKKFFLNPKNVSAKNEFFALVNALQDVNQKDVACRFPARTKYVSDVLDFNVSMNHCKDFKYYMKKSQGEKATLLFASSYLGSPMSYFGHTFIKVDRKDNPHFSQTFGFAASMSQNIGFGEMFRKGVFGGFEGKYTIEPYFKIIHAYNIIEQRSLVEYTLDLKQEEINRMLMHAYELYDINVAYGYYSENCAYAVLWLLEVARPTLDIRSDFGPIILPIETVVKLKDKNIITSISTRPSLIDAIYVESKKLSNKGRDFFIRLKDAENKKKLLEDANLTKADKEGLAYMINSYYDLLFKKYRHLKKDFKEVKNISYKKKKEMYFGENIKAINSGKFALGKLWREDGNLTSILSWTPFLFNRYFDKSSEVGEATVELFSIKLRHLNNNTKVEAFDLVKLESLTKRFDFYKPVSWRLNIGTRRNFLDKQSNVFFEVGFGAGWGDKHWLGYFLFQPSYYFDNNTLGIDFLSGVSFWFDKVHFGIDLKHSIDYTKEAPLSEANYYLTYPLSENWLFKASYERFIKESRASFAWRF